MIPEDQVKEINNSLYELTKEVEATNIKDNKEGEGIAPQKRTILNEKFANLVERVFAVLPKTSDTHKSLARDFEGVWI
jgi:hypothetical protein